MVEGVAMTSSAVPRLEEAIARVRPVDLPRPRPAARHLEGRLGRARRLRGEDGFAHLGRLPVAVVELAPDVREDVRRASDAPPDATAHHPGDVAVAVPG